MGQVPVTTDVFQQSPLAQQPTRRWLAPLLFVVLALVWGSSFMLMKRGLVVFRPDQVAALRLSIAAGWLLPLVWRDRKRLPVVPWRLVLVAALVGNLLPAFLFATAQTGVTSATAGALNALSPVFTVLLGALFWREPVPLLRALGIAVGLGGALALILARGDGGQQTDPRYALLIVVSALSYAISTNLLRYPLRQMEPLHLSGLALGSVGVPCALWLALSGLGDTMQQPGAWQALGYVAVLGTFGTAMSLVLFTKLLHLVGSSAASVTYLIPGVALAWGVADGESVVAQQLIGLVAILGGVWLANRPAATILEAR